jgi:precorrin-2/cobalt-factor-2 C20-methyltransferase
VTDFATGRLFGVGVGPGDPDLMTVAARRAVEQADVVAHFAAAGRPGNAWNVVAPFVTQRALRLEYPVTTERIDHHEYERLLEHFYEESSRRVAAELDAGLDVAVVCEGDPFFYGSYMYIHERLGHRYPTTVIPGVTSVSAAAAAAGVPLVAMDETLTIVPGVRSRDELANALDGADAAVVMKVGRRLHDVRDALRTTGLEDRAIYVERASCAAERVLPLADTTGVDAPYFSLVLVPGRGIHQRW